MCSFYMSNHLVRTRRIWRLRDPTKVRQRENRSNLFLYQLPFLENRYYTPQGRKLFCIVLLDQQYRRFFLLSEISRLRLLLYRLQALYRCFLYLTRRLNLSLSLVLLSRFLLRLYNLNSSNLLLLFYCPLLLSSRFLLPLSLFYPKFPASCYAIKVYPSVVSFISKLNFVIISS